MKLEDKKKKFIKGYIIFIIIFLIGFVRKELQNDTFYTIKTGELILNNGIDMLDHFSFHTGLSYTYPHWLYDVFIYLIYYIGSYTGIYISSIILFIILILIIFKINKKFSDNLSVTCFSTFICTISVSGFITARAQTVTYILFSLEIFFIESFLKNGNHKYLWGLILISLTICNMHVAVWPFYFVLYLPYIVEYLVAIICNKIKLKKENKFINFFKKRFIIEKNKNIKKLLIIMIISTLTGLITPIGTTPYTYFIKTTLGNSQKYIQEHQMLSWIYSPFPIIIAGETLFLTIISKTKLRDFFMICGLMLMTISSIRHMALLSVLGIICFNRVFSLFFETYNLKIDTVIINFFSKRKVTIITFIIVTIFSFFLTRHELNKDFINKELYPVDATNYIKENIDIDNMRLYNEYNFGSYLLLNDIKVFVDSRADLYTKQFSGFDYDILDDFHMINNNYQKTFEDYKITHVLIYKNDSLNDILKYNSNYLNLYCDEYFCLYEKKETPGVIVTYN